MSELDAIAATEERAKGLGKVERGVLGCLPVAPSRIRTQDIVDMLWNVGPAEGCQYDRYRSTVTKSIRRLRGRGWRIESVREHTCPECGHKLAPGYSFAGAEDLRLAAEVLKA